MEDPRRDGGSESDCVAVRAFDGETRASLVLGPTDGDAWFG